MNQKNIIKYLLILLALMPLYINAQTVCTVTGPNGYNGAPTTALNVTCGTVVPPPPPPPPPPPTSCAESQMSTALNGVTLHRQCSGQVNILPSSISYGGNLIDFGTILGNSTFPAYKYAGYSPTFIVQSGHYIALAFTPQVAGAFQLVANTSYGDGGTISLSTFPGGLTRGASGVICVQNQNASNSLYVGTSVTPCKLNVGTTYFINIADVDVNGNSLCYNGVAGSCSQSTLSYTLYR